MMRALGLHTLAQWACVYFYRWAVREIPPLHHDVGRVVIRNNELESWVRQRGAS